MPDVTQLLSAARRALCRGDHRKALPILQQAVRLGPELFGTHLLLGLCLSASGRQAQGLASLRRAVQLNPNSARGHYNLGAALKSAGRVKEAETHFAAALQLDPSYEVAATALRSLGQRQSARAARPARKDTRRPSDMPGWTGRAADTEVRSKGRPLQAQTPAKWALAVGLGVLLAATAGGWRTLGASRDAVVWWQPGRVIDIEFSPDGETLAAAGPGIRLFRVSDGTPIGSLGSSAGETVDVAFSPGGDLLAAACRDETAGASVKIWRVADGGLVGELPAHAGNRPLAFCPDGMLLAVGTDCLISADPLGVQLWSVPALQLVRTIAPPEESPSGCISAVAFSPDGDLLAAGDEAGTIRVCRIRDGAIVSTVDTGHAFLAALAFSPDGSLLAHAGMSGPRIALCTLPSGSEFVCLAGEQKTRGELGMPPAVSDLDFSSDATLLAASESTGDLARVEVFDLATGALIRTLDAGMATAEAPTGRPRRVADVRAVRFSPDGNHLAWCGSNGVVVFRVVELVG